MSRRKGTPEAELLDAIKRMNKKQEATEKASNSPTWKNYLQRILGINPASVQSEKGAEFWEDVRIGVQITKEPIAKQQLNRGNFFLNRKTHNVSYRNAKGQWTSFASVGRKSVV